MHYALQTGVVGRSGSYETGVQRVASPTFQSRSLGKLGQYDSIMDIG